MAFDSVPTVGKTIHCKHTVIVRISVSIFDLSTEICEYYSLEGRSMA